jgi:hypothetical protein
MMSGQIHVPPALILRKEALEHMELKAACFSELV